VYLFDTQITGFGGCFLVKKQLPDMGGSLKEGSWDSTHVVTVDLERQ
jgi:hypothetical protein